ncbi:MAG: MerR family transcriptional regulator [Tetrasphaera sp.]
MSTYVGIGEFAKLTHLSVKTLHHYHAVGLLEPSAVDSHTAYRRYGLDQVGAAHLIRRLRDLEMPIPEVAAVLAADAAERDDLLRAHLGRLQQRLERTTAAVASLRDMLGGGLAPEVGYRTLARQAVLAIRATVRREDIEGWCGESFGRLGALAAGMPRPTTITHQGPGSQPATSAQPETSALGATYAEEFFTAGAGEVLAFLPVAESARAVPGFERCELDGGRFAIACHAGAFENIDRTYGRLGSHVAEHDEGRAGPIREIYRVGPGDADDPALFRTDICWPVRPPTGS